MGLVYTARVQWRVASAKAYSATTVLPAWGGGGGGGGGRGGGTKKGEQGWVGGGWGGGAGAGVCARWGQVVGQETTKSD